MKSEKNYQIGDETEADIAFGCDEKKCLEVRISKQLLDKVENIYDRLYISEFMPCGHVKPLVVIWKMGGKLRHTHGRSIEIMIQLKKGAKTTNVLIEYLSKLKTYETYPQRSNVCNYLGVCRKAGMITTRKLFQARFHQHSLTVDGEEYLKQVRNDAAML